MATNLHLLLELGFRFNPSPEEVVTYYLPRLIAGHPPKDTESCIHRANVYGAEPRELAAQFAPVARSSNGDRFFLTECKRIKGKVSRVAGGGSWVSQTSKDIKNREGIKVGEAKNFRFKKDGTNTDWLMEEYHLCLRQASDLEPVLCRVYVSPRAAKDSAAHQESAALTPQEPALPLAHAPAPALIQEPAALPRQELAPAPPRLEAVITQQQATMKMGGSVPASKAARQSCVTASAPPPRRVAPQPAPPSLRTVPAAVAPPRQVPVITQQQAPPLKRPAPPVPSPPCAKKIRGPVSASPVARQSCVAASAPPPWCVPPPPRPAPPSRRVMAPLPTYPMDPFETPPSPHAPRHDPFEPPPSPDPPIQSYAIDPPIQSYAMDPFEQPPSPYAPHGVDDMDEFTRSLEAQLEEADGDEIAAATVAPPMAQNVAPDDDMDEFTRSLEAQLEEADGDDKIDDDEIDEEIFQIPLKD
uniref:NAC domain-containing protein n=1 Tax=Oryza barthii TaxID=65489 RepID=A0A0D3HTQ2_9ORYZ